ncbi:MAG TPA: ATP-binding cassette domain-containing protein [Terriglobia bacterium]|nr:ATP-binding cassette domain-containing protein [Terriglobia bacterium]
MALSPNTPAAAEDVQAPRYQPRPPAIELRRVSLAFDENRVLNDISLSVPSAGTLVLLGVTGSGKSVLLKLMLGLLKPESGEILIEGENIVPLDEDQLNVFRRRMGIVFQEGALFDSLSVFENVSYRLWEEGQRDEELIERRVREVLGFVDLAEAIDKAPDELSGGMRRRVAIARAIISEPSIMLYDSPTAGLDPVTANTISSLIVKLRDVQHVTSIVVTHRVPDAMMLSGFAFSVEKQGLVPAASPNGKNAAELAQFIVLRDSRISFQGSRQELLESRDPYLCRFTD